MAYKVVIHSPKGGQGKTTITANLSIMLAEKDYNVLVIDGCSSRQFQNYFNVKAEHGVFDFLSGTPLHNLIGELRKKLYLLPAGDLVKAERFLDEDKISPISKVEERLKEYEEEFDFIIFDTAPNEDTRFFFNILHYIDCIITPIETKRAGFDKTIDFRDLIDGINPRLREPFGKEPLQIDILIPYWFDKRVGSKQGILELIKEEFEEVSFLTEPIRECDGIHLCWGESQSLSERLSGKRKPPSNEAQMLKIFQSIVDYLITE